MPPPRPVPGRQRHFVLVATLLAALAGAGVMWSVVRYASENPDKANLGDRVFQVGRAERLAREVDARGPFLFQDPLFRGTGRNLYIQHLGEDPEKGWLAVEARLPDQPACAVVWDRADAEFVDCAEGRHPPDGTGLTTYPGSVADGQVSVDLRTRPDEG